MFTLKGRQDGYRFLLPDNFIPEELNEKYSKLLMDAHSFVYKPIDFLNETIQKIQVFGFSGATVAQQQPGRGYPNKTKRSDADAFMYGSSEFNYRSVANPVSIIDKTFNVIFLHRLGYLNYMLMNECFLYQYNRAYTYDQLDYNFHVDLYNQKGSIYSRITLVKPLIDGIDMLDFDYSQPVASSQTFNVSFKYSNFDYSFIEFDEHNDGSMIS